MIVFGLANSVDPDEMMHYAAFHLGLHCLLSIYLGVTSIKIVEVPNVIQIKKCLLSPDTPKSLWPFYIFLYFYCLFNKSFVD